MRMQLTAGGRTTLNNMGGVAFLPLTCELQVFWIVHLARALVRLTRAICVDQNYCPYSRPTSIVGTIVCTTASVPKPSRLSHKTRSQRVSNKLARNTIATLVSEPNGGTLLFVYSSS
jgi:hypothetical protein